MNSNFVASDYHERAAKSPGATDDQDETGRTSKVNMIELLTMACLWHSFLVPLHPNYLFTIRTCVSVSGKVSDFSEDRLGKMLHAWELVNLGDPLRKEAAPFSGSYFKLLRHKGEIPDTCERVDEAAVVRFINTCHLLPDTNNRRQNDCILRTSRSQRRRC